MITVNATPEREAINGLTPNTLFAQVMLIMLIMYELKGKSINRLSDTTSA